MAAEDLEGGDDEYVRWAGEYKLIQRLQEKLLKLQEISYEGKCLQFRRRCGGWTAGQSLRAEWH